MCVSVLVLKDLWGEGKGGEEVGRRGEVGTRDREGGLGEVL